jgi:gamma-glutamylcyclotransferase (GGCT)/AIG2-like uncharacterized protein YtfP
VVAETPAAHLPLMASNPELLFVYGTLRPALAVGWPRKLVADLEVVGVATVSGLLYDLGDYPGMVAGEGVVHGDLLRIGDEERLAAIDAYEECGGPQALYRREAVLATLANGTRVEAWAYFFTHPTGGAPVIADGDYLRRRGGG